MDSHPFHRHGIQQLILDGTSRESVLDWLKWNDPNGVYDDADCDAEGISRMTLESAQALMREQLNR